MSDTKNILIVSKSFYPENSPRSFRATQLVKEFSRQGHEVTLLTVKQDEVHKPFEKEYGVQIKDFGPLKFPEFDLKKGGKISFKVKRILRRALIQFFEYPTIELLWRVKKSIKKESGYDLLISIAVPHPVHWGVARVWNQNKIADTWIADCGDPYMGQTLDSFNKFYYFKYFEKDFCRKADFITVPIEEAKKGYYPEFRNKIEVIPQGFDFDEVEIEKGNYTENNVPTFAYAGSLIPGGRDPRKMLDYLLQLEKPYKFIFYTNTPSLVEPYVKKSGGQVEVRDTVPRAELLKKLSGMDFLVNFENESSLMMPSKLIDYYLTGRPVLSVESFNIPQKAIDEFLNGNYRLRYEFKDMDRYRIENVCKRFLALSNKNNK